MLVTYSVPDHVATSIDGTEVHFVKLYISGDDKKETLSAIREALDKIVAKGTSEAAPSGSS